MRFKLGLLIPNQNHSKSEFGGDSTYNKYLLEKSQKVFVAKDAIQAFVAGIEQRPTESYSFSCSIFCHVVVIWWSLQWKAEDDLRFTFVSILVKEYAKRILKLWKEGRS